MWCLTSLIFTLIARTLAAPLSSEKPMVLFTCPEVGDCYASPRNCVDECNAAFSMWHRDGRTTFNITMLSGLGYVALLIRDRGTKNYDKAIVCSFHQTRGIVAKVDYPDPLVIHEFIETTEPEGNTDSLYTQCSTSAEVAMPTRAHFKLLSGKWESELVLDERLGIDVVPAVENAKILSTNEPLNIPAPKRKPAVRASTSSEVDMDKASESFIQKKQFEKKSKEEKEAKLNEMKKRIEKEEEDRMKKEDDEDDDDEAEEVTKKSSKTNVKETKGKDEQSKKTKDKSKKMKGNEDDDAEEEDDEEKKNTKKTKKGDDDEDEEEEKEIPRFREYEDEDDEHQ
ncbi:hypothetical protein RB195_017088 [Necator americanus]|uniref:Uncharacterized protein n=1 Tax=Necator americanus TaxID=51031 RepID=A0ABR1C3J0_NECAM